MNQSLLEEVLKLLFHFADARKLYKLSTFYHFEVKIESEQGIKAVKIVPKYFNN